MTKVSEIVSYFEALVPSEMKMDFDNVGFLVGTKDRQVKTALVALDITNAVIDEAIEKGAEIILSHHPLFFQLKQVNDGDLNGAKVVKLLANGISALCQHTNLDSVSGGVNDALAAKLGIRVEGFLEYPKLSSAGSEYGMGRFGHLKSPTDLNSFLMSTKNLLETRGIRYYDAGKPVFKVAVCGGSGGEFLAAAAALGCDTLVTADVKYHSLLEARELGINILDADHFCTENVVVPVLASMLKTGFPDLEVLISEASKQIVSFF